MLIPQRWVASARHPLLRLSPNSKLLVGVICGVALLLLTLWFAHRSVQQVRGTSQWTYHTLEVRLSLSELREALFALESRERGYLLTGDAWYLSASARDRARLQAELAELRLLISDNPDQLARLTGLQQLAAVRMQQMERAVGLRQQGNTAPESLLTEKERQTLWQFDDIAERMSLVEMRLLERRHAGESISLWHNLIWSAALSTTAVVLLALAYLVVRRENAARARAVRLLDETNANLETRIAASVQELSMSNAALRSEVQQRAATEAELQRSHELLETRVRERTAELSAAIASKTRFLSAASHDLRQPLHSLTLLNATLRGQPLGALGREIVEAQRQSLESMSKLVNSLLNISMLEAGVIRPQIRDFAMDELISSLGAEFAPIAHTRDLALRVEGGYGIVHSDPTLLRQIIQNLVGNALRYTLRGEVRVLARVDGAQVCLQVSDTGPGIPADQLERIFEEFQQLAPATGQQREGFGLGLSIVRHLTQLLGIELKVSSVVGMGTTFTLLVPAGQSAPLAHAPRNDEQVISPHRGRILLLDDETPVRNATALFLRMDGHEVRAAGSVEEATALLEAQTHKPDVIVSDFQLGGTLTGVDFIERARAFSGTVIPSTVGLIHLRAASANAPLLKAIKCCA